MLDEASNQIPFFPFAQGPLVCQITFPTGHSGSLPGECQASLGNQGDNVSEIIIEKRFVALGFIILLEEEEKD